MDIIERTIMLIFLLGVKGFNFVNIQLYTYSNTSFQGAVQH